MTKHEYKNKRMIIYKIQNKIDGKCYIGQTIYAFYNRYGGYKWYNHIRSQYLKNAVMKHGYENFSIEILQDNVNSLEELNKLEIEYAHKFNSLVPNGYNLEVGGSHGLHHEETKNKIAKEFIIKNYKTGEIFNILNLAAWCRKMGLNKDLMNHVLNKREHSSGSVYLACGDFCHPDTTNEMIDRRHLRKYKDKTFRLISPEGKLYIVNNLCKFAKEMSLKETGFYALCVKGSVWSYKGWQDADNPKPKEDRTKPSKLKYNWRKTPEYLAKKRQKEIEREVKRN